MSIGLLFYGKFGLYGHLSKACGWRSIVMVQDTLENIKHYVFCGSRHFASKRGSFQSVCIAGLVMCSSMNASWKFLVRTVVLEHTQSRKRLVLRIKELNTIQRLLDFSQRCKANYKRKLVYYVWSVRRSPNSHMFSPSRKV